MGGTVWTLLNTQSTCWQRWKVRCRTTTVISTILPMASSMCCGSIIWPCTWRNRNMPIALSWGWQRCSMIWYAPPAALRAHMERSAKLAKQLLASYDLPPERQQTILHAIMAHGYRHGIEPATLEARVLYDADRLDSLGASGVMRWAMTTKRRRWPEMRTYHPDDPFALWREPDGQHYLLDRFFTKLLKLQEAMTTTTGRAMAERRIAFLRLYLQELLHELAEGGSGYD